MRQSGRLSYCDVSEYYLTAYMSAVIKRTIYSVVKNIKMAQFYKLVFILGCVYHLDVHETE